MFERRSWFLASLAVFMILFAGNSPANSAPDPEMTFDHNHTFPEVVDYLNGMVKAYPKLARLHTIGKSYLGKSQLMLGQFNWKVLLTGL